MPMFKSIFARYVMTFMALLTVSFLLLLFIVNSMIRNDAERAAQQNMARIAAVCAQNTVELMEADGQADLSAFMMAESAEGSGSQLSRVFSSVLVHFDDMTVYVTDAGGGFLFSTGKASAEAPAVGYPLISPTELHAEAVTESPAVRMPSFSTETDGEDTYEGTFLETSPTQAAQGLSYVLPITTRDGIGIGYA